MDSKKLLEDALHLSVEDRAKLAGDLIVSLDDAPPDAGVEEAWALEVRKRLAELDEGTVKAIPASKFLSDLQAAARGKSA